jgi:hypothetical protein
VTKVEGSEEQPDIPASALSRIVSSQRRQAREFVADMVRVRGLMPLLMKHRNGGHWSAAEKAELLAQLRVLSRVSPYLLFLLLPGSALLLPAYAWWLDRRRKPRPGRTQSGRPPIQAP